MTAALVAAQDEPPGPPANEAQVSQENESQSPQQSERRDAPGRVARLQYMSGSVSIQPEGNGEWVAGAINRPLTNADNVWTDKNSRAELNLGTGVMRLNSESSLTFTNVNDNTAQVELHQGTLNLRVRHLFDGEIYEVDTPNMAFTVQKTGEYRFDVDPNGDSTVVTVWKGEGDATGQGPSVRVKAHERARFTASNSLAHEISPAPAYDGFDDWCRVRNQREDHSISAQYVAPGTIGYEDLDEYGTWREVAPYGPVWVPSGVAVGWAPYTYGHWVWVGPWGWTWVDYEPWGFAPFHYGRWVYSGGFWGWAPGPFYARPFYAPALVAWFGGPRWGVGFGFGFGGGIGWCPLGFGEPFVPWYWGSRGYFRHVNIYNTRFTNFTHITNVYYNHGHGPIAGNAWHYANLKAPGGAVAVSQRTMVNSLAVNRNRVQVSSARFTGSSLGSRMPVAPQRTSRLGMNAGRPAAMPPARSFARPTVSRMAAPAGMQSRAGMNANLGARTSARGPAGGPAGARFGGTARNVPQPSQGAAFGTRGVASGNRSVPMTARNYVPRPPSAGGTAAFSGSSRYVPRPGASNNSRFAPQSRMATPRSAPEVRSIPRGPSGGSYSRPNVNNSPRSMPDAGRGRSFSSVPRPTGPVRPASQADYASRSYSGRSYSGTGSYGARSDWSGSGRGYSQSPRYSQPSYSSPGYRSYSAPSSRSYSTPSYRSYSASPSYRSYSAPSRSYSAPSYGGGRSYGGRSYGGSSGRSGGGFSGGSSYHGGGGGGGGHSGRR
jgi:hypothetical protein